MLESLLQLIAPSRCPLCGEYLAVGEQRVCAPCGASLLVSADHCERTLVPRISLYTHDLHVRSAILALKFGGDSWRGLAMGHLFEHARAHLDGLELDAIVPVPLHRRRLRERGYNQAERIARGVSASLGFTLRTDLLARVRHDPAQATATEETRRARENPFKSRGGPRRHVLIVDDVITTGTTLVQAADALLRAGHKPAAMLAVARQPRHDASVNL